MEEVDDAIIYGAGLRWAAMGTFLTYRLAGGEAGMRHFMAQFGPALKLPWTKLTDVPDLDDALLDKLVAQSDAQAAGRSIEDLTRIRDDCLIAILRGLRDEGFAAGEALAQAEHALLARAGVEPAAPGEAVVTAAVATDRPPAAVTGGLLRLHEAVVAPEWIDYNGHMTEGRYLMVLADATDAFLAHVGVDAPYVDTGRSYYTVETHIRHLDEAHVGQGLYVLTRLLGHDEKRLHLFHELRRADDRPLATGEHMLLHVDRAAQRTVPASAALLDALDAIARTQHGLPRPEGAGSRIDGGRVSGG
jgi:carnitine 3-dehydrogenase